MLRRRPFALPFPDQAEDLARVLAGHAVEPVEPTRFVDAALYHNVAGEVAAGPAVLPTAERRRLADRQAVRAARSSLLRRVLAEESPRLAAECGAPPVLLKGPAVADRYYARRDLRPFADLDLLLPRDRLAAAAEALRARGYEVLEEFAPGFGVTHGHDVHVRKRIGPRSVDVELHWRVGDDPVGDALAYEVVAPGAETLTVAAVGVLVPAGPDELLVLALHLLSDRAKRLAWIRDLQLAAQALTEREWRGAFTRARELGLGWVLHRALDYAEHILAYRRDRPEPPGAPPPFGPLRAVEELDVRAAPHLGRLALLGWRARGVYLREVLLPTRAGLRGTVGLDGAPTWRLVLRHAGRAAAGLAPRRRS